MIKIDSREPEMIFKIFDKHRIPYKKTYLAVGDIVINNCVIERKTVEDFYISMRDRLWQQLINMENNYDHSFLIIVGKLQTLYEHYFIKFNLNAYLGGLCSIAVKFKTKILFVENHHQYANIVNKIALKLKDTTCKEHVMRKKLTTDDIIINILSCVPKLGVSKCKELKKYYRPVLVPIDYNKLPKLDVNDLMKIKGIGRKLATNIRGVFK